MNNILERNDKLDFFFDSSSELIVIIDKDENFKRINKSWTKALGWTEEELLSMKWKNIIHKDDIESTNDFLIECEKYHSNRNIESRYISKDGFMLISDEQGNILTDENLMKIINLQVFILGKN